MGPHRRDPVGLAQAAALDHHQKISRSPTFNSADGEWGNVYVLPEGTTVKPGGAVVVTSDVGVDKTDPDEPQGYHMDFRCGYNGYWLNDSGDIVYLDKAEGRNVDSYAYDFNSGYYV
ncbi:hypothetical protein AB0K60_11740 [Thermopolyspora sp. NPDC052614]|uniref:hypothetical protein n=1 Tax=Thermopolyspora sp. NPDC052614 TaxID=3155682 RepID=UPI00341A0503